MIPHPNRRLAIVAAVAFYALAGWLFLCCWAAADLGFLACPDGYSIWASPDCRQPVLASPGSTPMTIAAKLGTAGLTVDRASAPARGLDGMDSHPWRKTQF